MTDSLVVALDPDRLEQALDNLLTNALRHGSARSIELRERDGAVELHVFDEGPGFPESSSACFRALHARWACDAATMLIVRRIGVD